MPSQNSLPSHPWRDVQSWRDGTSRDSKPRDSHPVRWNPEWPPNYSLSDPGRGSHLLLLVTLSYYNKFKR
ncbi:hypothetical protein COCMIDRAFT_110043 [Bipolaris oryzae ATCC 44560]|uniref:Uncharacterized protein n=1 Tax=Bipolaris oryzae ATCC 44560 TaxID=930090 RepID=W6YL82_COCMI|nr:uncharacterized protein COCMIDRAFT_110043 [Bipolaris oryzae ATCC 44560]EUC39957.1 hypothetical protein COCMIDRAFT_110043 [Bipolaris oryzae ATCC 44560]